MRGVGRQNITSGPALGPRFAPAVHGIIVRFLPCPTRAPSTPVQGLTLEAVPVADVAAGARHARATSTAPAPSATPIAALDEAFGGRPHAIHYALKANSTLAIVRLMRALGSHVDANSMGEVDVALRCGFTPRQIVFTGVGKSAGELERAVDTRLPCHQRRVAGRTRPPRPASPRRTASRRGWRCASIPTSTPRAIRTSRPGCATTSSACRSRSPAGLFVDMARAARSRAGGRAHPHRLADHDADAARQGGRGRHRAGARTAGGRRAARADRLRRRTRHLLRRHAGARPRRLRACARRGGRRHPARTGDRARTLDCRPGRRCSSPPWSTSSTCPAAAASSCSTPA